jgi:uncharacterized protein (TIGR01244 family)
MTSSSAAPGRPGARFLSQLSERDIVALADEGVRLVVNNRPEEELPSTPGALIEKACQEAGIRYIAAPVRGWPAEQDVEAVADGLARLKDDESAALYCRSGARSAVIWALAEQRLGRLTPGEIRDCAAASGFDLSSLPL